jgi:hypothetical protein
MYGSLACSCGRTIGKAFVSSYRTSPVTAAQNLEKKQVLFHATAVTAQLSHDKSALCVDLFDKFADPSYVASA